ncbi:MAG: hypothetical protein ACREQX_06985 [Candidatus Binataceae bacterium]
MAADLLSIHAQLAVRHGCVHGYVKPLFSDLKEFILQPASDLFKNECAHKVAPHVDRSGKLKNPSANTWQAIIEVLHNAFIKATLPGFDRQIWRLTATHQ